MTRRLLTFAALLLIGACRAPTRSRITAEEATLERRGLGLQALIAAAEKGAGRILGFEHIMIVVRQHLVQQIIDAALPFEREIAGKYRVAARSARVLFEDGFAAVQLGGQASLLEQPVTVDVTVHGAIDIVELDPVSGILRGRVTVYAVEARRVSVAGVGAPAEKLVEDIGQERLESFAPLLSSLEIPVKLEQRITLPAPDGKDGVRIEAAEVPVSVLIKDVKSFRQRLWITVEAATTDGRGA